MLSTVEIYDEAALTALIASATLLGTDLKAALFINTPTITKKSVIADFTEPTYTGYAQQGVVLGTPIRDPSVGIVSLGAALLWQGTALLPVTINGIFYIYGASPLLLGAEYFETPISLNDATDAFKTVLEYIQSSSNPGFTQILR